MLNKDTAICIRVCDYSETSQIVTFFCKDSGKIDVIAKGAKRAKSAFSGTIELLSAGRVIFSAGRQGQLGTLVEFETELTDFGGVGLRQNLFGLNCSFFAAELVGLLTDFYDPHPELFEKFANFLKNVGQESLTTADRKIFLAFLILFQLGLLSEAGLLPVLSRCANCKNPFGEKWQQVYFSSSANGILCGDCELNFADRLRLKIEVGSCLSELRLLESADISVLKDIEKLLVYHFTQICNQRPKMAKYILSLI